MVYIHMKDANNRKAVWVEDVENHADAAKRFRELQKLNPSAYYYVARHESRHAKDRATDARRNQEQTRLQTSEHEG